MGDREKNNSLQTRCYFYYVQMLMLPHGNSKWEPLQSTIFQAEDGLPVQQVIQPLVQLLMGLIKDSLMEVMRNT